MQGQNSLTPPLVTSDIISLNNSDQNVKRPTTTHTHSRTNGPFRTTMSPKNVKHERHHQVKEANQHYSSVKDHLTSCHPLPFPSSPPTPAPPRPPRLSRCSSTCWRSCSSCRGSGFTLVASFAHNSSRSQVGSSLHYTHMLPLNRETIIEINRQIIVW